MILNRAKVTSKLSLVAAVATAAVLVIQGSYIEGFGLLAAAFSVGG